MKAMTNASSRRPSSHSALRPAINPQVYSLMTVPFPVFTNDDNGRITPTITHLEWSQLNRCAQ